MALTDVLATGETRVSLSRLARKHAKFVVVLSLTIVDAVWIYLAGFSFEPVSAVNAAVVSTVMLALSYIYTLKRPNPNLATACYETAVLLSFTAAGAVLSYLVTTLNLPLIDGKLVAVDALMGFDWTTYVAFVNQHPMLGQLSSIVYMTTLSQVALTVIFLSLVGNPARASLFVWAIMISALICIAISGLLPAAGALATVQPPTDFLDRNAPFVDLAYKQTFFDLRDGTLTAISLVGAKGLIAFPSYHCALSMVVVLAYWRVRWMFVPVAALNLAVLLSTPVDGGHHMIDGLAGMLVALASWWIASQIARKLR